MLTSVPFHKVRM